MFAKLTHTGKLIERLLSITVLFKIELFMQRQQEQLKDIKLPASANWAHQPTSVHSTMSVASIQKQEAAEERKKEQEQVISWKICFRFNSGSSLLKRIYESQWWKEAKSFGCRLKYTNDCLKPEGKLLIIFYSFGLDIRHITYDYLTKHIISSSGILHCLTPSLSCPNRCINHGIFSLAYERIIIIEVFQIDFYNITFHEEIFFEMSNINLYTRVLHRTMGRVSGPISQT